MKIVTNKKLIHFCMLLLVCLSVGHLPLSAKNSANDAVWPETSFMITSDLFQETEEAGVQVYVLPGNHDIMNPFAASFLGDKHELIDSVYPKDFADIYNNFGYLESIYRDPNSLSYVVEPVGGLWLVCIDSNYYSGNYNNGYPWPYGSVQTFHFLLDIMFQLFLAVIPMPRI